MDGHQLGFSKILHTWYQKLNAHFHLHCLIPGGVLINNGEEWKSCTNAYLFPEAALCKVFRGKFMDYFKNSYRKGELEFPGTTASLGTMRGMKHLTDTLWQKKDWIVHIEPPLDRPDKVLEYLGRCTHRVAISNHRIVFLIDGNVTFTVKNRDTGRIERETLAAAQVYQEVFTARFTETIQEIILNLTGVDITRCPC